MTSLSILQISDLHILPESHNALLGVNTEYYFNAVLDLALKNHQPFDLILVTGDLGQEPCMNSYQRILERLSQTQIPCLCLPGNHDDYKLMQSVLNSLKVNCKKQWLLKNWQIICLNSQIQGASSGYLETNELDFLEHCLINNPTHHTIIAVHHNCIPTHSNWLDTMTIKNAQELLNRVKPYPQLKTITTGHVHQEMDLSLNGIRFLGTPSTCFQFKPLSQSFSIDSKMPGYRVINAYEDGSIDTSVFRLSGELKELDLSSKSY